MNRSATSSAGHAFLALGLVVSAGQLSGCAPVIGYADNPSDETVVLANLEKYFDPSCEDAYAALTDATERKNLRDRVVMNRLRAYDINFGQFERRMWGEGNTVSAGGDLVALILGGLGATTGSAATKAALAAASAGVIGAQGVISKDLYYQRTLPALLAQMESNREKVKLSILTGLQKPDTAYSLFQADLDLDALQRASGIPGAIGNITEQAMADKAATQARIDALRSGGLSTTATTTRLRKWLFPTADAQGKAVLSTANYAKLQQWMTGSGDPVLQAVLPETLADAPDAAMEVARQQAIGALNVP